MSAGDTCAAPVPVYACGVKKRLDVLLVERGLAESRAQAQALVLAGRVPGHAKAGEQVDERAELVVERPPRYVSRGGEKLEHALEALAVSVGGPRLPRRRRVDRRLHRLPAPARRRARDRARRRLRPAPPSACATTHRVTVLERVNARHLPELRTRPSSSRATSRSSRCGRRLPPALAARRPGLAGAARW